MKFHLLLALSMVAEPDWIFWLLFFFFFPLLQQKLRKCVAVSPVVIIGLSR